MHQLPFLSLWYDSTWVWTPVFRTAGNKYKYTKIYVGVHSNLGTKSKGFQVERLLYEAK